MLSGMEKGMKLTCACEVTPLKTEILLIFTEGSFDYHQHAGDGQRANKY